MQSIIRATKFGVYLLRIITIFCFILEEPLYFRQFCFTMDHFEEEKLEEDFKLGEAVNESRVA